MGSFPTGPESCLADPSCHVYITSMRNAVPLTIFGFWGFVILSCFTFQFWKFLHSKRRKVEPVILRSAMASESVSTAVKHKKSSQLKGVEVILDMEGGKELQVTGYTGSFFGELCYLLCCFTSLHWLALDVVIIFDYYNKCQVRSVDNLCFYGNYFLLGNYELNGKVFFVVFWLQLIWFTAWVLFKGKVHNCFRLPTELSSAKVVSVWARDQEEILSTTDSFLINFLREIKTKFSSHTTEGHSFIIPIETTKRGRRQFVFQGQRFLIKGDSVQPVHFKVGETYSDYYEHVKGIHSNEADSRLEKIGPNEIPFKPDTLIESICDETFSLFHVYQLGAYMLAFWGSYLFVGALLATIVVLSASITIYTRRRNQFMISKITKYVTEVEVLRDGVWIKIDSRCLVPGDVVRLQRDWKLPCDLLIIKGSCICDESALTGESMPVQKYNAPIAKVPYNPQGNGARHTLFSGTTVIQSGSQTNDDVQAIVTATGMATSKGELLSGILYPQILVFKYDEELPVVVLFLIAYAIVCFIISIIFQNHTGSQSIWVTKWMYCMFSVNQILNPLLPVALEVGQLHAVNNLKKRGILCLNPKRIAIAGKIRVFCFDKTGTLTKEGLDFLGVQCSLVDSGIPTFGPLVSPAKVESLSPLVTHGLATCHAVAKFGEEYVGNQVEVKMFSSVGWELVEATQHELPYVANNKGKMLKIVKQNEFDHARATMSVIIEDRTGTYYVYCKGSFEKIKDMSTPETIPEDYLEKAREHALEGCYVLGLGYRKLDSTLTRESVLALTRDEIEMDLKFISLILFRNELKDDSAATMEALKEGEVRPVMVTGDNAQCGHYIAKKSGMVSQSTEVLLGDVGKDERITWSSLSAKCGATVQRLSTEDLMLKKVSSLEEGSVELAITGRAFNVLRDEGLLSKLFLFMRIYARFSPADKVEVATMHRDKGLTVGMCGDGGNDCGALRAAHAGIALSAAEASVVSPFTARDKNVISVVDLLIEGRGALHTSFASYKFIIMYGLMFSVFKLCCYWYGVIACEMDYVSIDGVAVLVLGYAMTRSQPEHKLNKIRPTSSLLGPINVASVLGMWIINLCFFVGAVCFMSSQKEYVKWPAKYSHGATWWTLGDNWESTVLFFTMYFQFITGAFIFTFGATFRKNVLFNWLLLVSYGGLVTLFSLLLLLPPSGFTSIWHVASQQFNSLGTSSPVWVLYQENGGHPSPGMPFSFRLKLLFIIFASIATNVFWQKVIIEGPVAAALAQKYPSQRTKFLV
ncbi:hypothetical protein O6H91_11G004100 [Diphasiastrum complanatum]|uniref:Uncharacterized protein n=2 Tax=Diphasiastrum complanatum TaxID=34168 RepID=A0ACC2C5V1_DIPCM|nr:hypothetical protein O6H91_11G004100 [Diphasiastrum complanatum]KAJ7537389.1 hypothetical protein O6H91_11G004100 [Diphasiastrum complanatum]